MSRMSEASGAGDRAGPAAPDDPVRIAADTRLYVPAHRRRPADSAQEGAVGLELQTVAATGELVAVAFTTPEALAEALGESQPWIALRAGRFAELVRLGGLGRMSVNPVMSPGTRAGHHLRSVPDGRTSPR